MMAQRCRSGAHVWDTVAEANRCCSPSWRRALAVRGDPTADGDPAVLDAFGRISIPCGSHTVIVGWRVAPVWWRPRGGGHN